MSPDAERVEDAVAVIPAGFGVVSLALDLSHIMIPTPAIKASNTMTIYLIEALLNRLLGSAGRGLDGKTSVLAGSLVDVKWRRWVASGSYGAERSEPSAKQ